MRVVLYARDSAIKYIVYEKGCKIVCDTIERAGVPFGNTDIVKVLDKVIEQHMKEVPYAKAWKKLFSIELVMRDCDVCTMQNNNILENVVFTSYESLISIYDKLKDDDSVEIEKVLREYYDRGNTANSSMSNRLIYEQGCYGIDTYVETNKSYKVMFLNEMPITKALNRFCDKVCVFFYDERYFSNYFGIHSSQEFQNTFLGDVNSSGVFPVITSEGGKEKKDISSMLHIVDCLVQSSISREMCIVAFGGGVLLDMVGFAAAMYKRGIEYIKIPTTLIGQIDAGLGIKVGVNYTSKNLLGFFYPPRYVLLANEFISPLEIEKIECGLAEIIKTAIICDYDLLDKLSAFTLSELCNVEDGITNRKEKNELSILEHSVVGLLDLLKRNQYEKGSTRRLFDFGHSFSGVLEKYKIRHGYAVAIDMLFCCILSVKEGYIDRDYFAFLLNVFCKCNVIKVQYIDIFLQNINEIFDASIESTMKKRDGNLNLVIPIGFGRVGFINLAECSDSGDAYIGIYSKEKLRVLVNEACGELALFRTYFE